MGERIQSRGVDVDCARICLDGVTADTHRACNIYIYRGEIRPTKVVHVNSEVSLGLRHRTGAQQMNSVTSRLGTCPPSDNEIVVPEGSVTTPNRFNTRSFLF